MKYLNRYLFTLVSLLLLFSSAAFAEPGGDLNLQNKASLTSRSGFDLTLGTEGSSDTIDFVVAGASVATTTFTRCIHTDALNYSCTEAAVA